MQAWIFKHFSDCLCTVPNIEYTEMEPQMCRWKPQQCKGNIDMMIIVLRERLDDLTEIDVLSFIPLTMSYVYFLVNSVTL